MIGPQIAATKISTAKTIIARIALTPSDGGGSAGIRYCLKEGAIKVAMMVFMNFLHCVARLPGLCTHGR